MIGKRAGGRAELIARYHQHICRAAVKVAQTGSVARQARTTGYSRLERNIMERGNTDQRLLAKFIASVIDSMGHEQHQEPVHAPTAANQFAWQGRSEAAEIA